MNNKINTPKEIQANAKKVYKVKQSDMPVCCPMPDMVIWNSHPRVYIPLNKKTNPKDLCPYCGAEFELE